MDKLSYEQKLEFFKEFFETATSGRNSLMEYMCHGYHYKLGRIETKEYLPNCMLGHRLYDGKLFLFVCLTCDSHDIQSVDILQGRSEPYFEIDIDKETERFLYKHIYIMWDKLNQFRLAFKYACCVIDLFEKAWQEYQRKQLAV